MNQPAAKPGTRKQVAASHAVPCVRVGGLSGPSTRKKHTTTAIPVKAHTSTKKDRSNE
jgi:hypothetical protein